MIRPIQVGHVGIAVFARSSNAELLAARDVGIELSFFEQQ
jgi:hypothetical protein